MSYLSNIPSSETYSLFSQRNSSLFYLYQNLKYGKVYYKNKVLCLLSGKYTSSTIEKLHSELESEGLLGKNTYKVWHLFYEFGFSAVQLEELITDHSILAIQLCYQTKKKISLESVFQKKLELVDLSNVNQKAYSKKFKVGYKHLERGNCYQFNLTENFIFSFPNTLSADQIIQFVFKDAQKLSAYAHASNIPKLSQVFLSNSPECLFSLRKLASSPKDFWQLRTMPIKGTVKREEGSNLKELWAELENSEKNENELLMITDLLRNDLSKIEEPKAKVIAERLPLLVPGLLHQYSLIEVLLSKNVSLLKIIKALFPGGSITGAPKKRVMKILHEMEKRERGFYCGSTLLIGEGKVSASINIRSAQINLTNSTIEIAAGGGVTLMSEAQDEFRELKAKLASFLSLWT